MVLDGPVDAIWVELLNLPMEGKGFIQLANNEKVPITKNFRFLFEVEDLKVASPATVARNGMVFINFEELGWEPYVTSWISNKSNKGAEF